MKITLINPPLTLDEAYGNYSDLASFLPQLGLCALASYLIKYGYKEVRIIDANVLGSSLSNIVKDVMSDSPDLIGIYNSTSNYFSVSSLVSEIKKTKRSQKIVLGGPHPSFLPEEILTETAVDYCVIGEGEETLLELVQHIEGNSDELNKIDGLAYKTSDDKIIINKPRKRIDDLDSLPFPAVHLLPPLSKYKFYPLQSKRSPYMTLITSRGCPYNCVFCETPFGKTVRYHSPEYVVNYIDYLVKQFGVKELCFVDDTFTLKEKRVFEICGLIQKINLDVSWYSATRANIKDKTIFNEMRKAGCWICAIGAESGDPEVLRLIGKGVSLDEIKSSCEAVLKAGIVLKTFFILGNPGETLETIEKTIKFAKSLKAHYPVFSLMTPFPGTELWNTAEKYGTFDRSNFQKLIISTADPVFVPYGLTKEILLKKQKEAFRRTYFSLGMVKKQLCAIKSIDDVKKLGKAAIAFLKLQFN
ncbi:B12-binding domain-containing radical SAM protein [bacterium]|nr:B12-binding domain-containing radical SAM protein [bacterium]